MKKKFLSDKQRKTTRRRLVQACGFVLIVLAGLACVAFATYNPNDPSMFRATLLPVQNQLGKTGAYAADFVMHFLRYTAWVIPIVLAAWGMHLMRSAVFGIKFWLMPVITLGALPVIAGLLSLHKPPANWPYEMGMGGIIGDEVLRGVLLLTGGVTQASFPVLRGLAILLPLSVLLLWCACGIRWRYVRPLLTYFWYGIREIKRYISASIFRMFSGVKERIHTRRTNISTHQSTKDNYNGDTATLVIDDTSVIKRRAGFSVERTEPRVQINMVTRPAEKQFEEEQHASQFEVNDKQAAPRKQATERSSSIPSYAGNFELPPMNLLQVPDYDVRPKNTKLSNDILQEQAQNLETVLDDYGIRGEIINVRPGPVVTLYELEPAPGLKASRVISLADDIARSMSALSARVSTVAGRNVIGIELPNDDRETVLLSELLQHHSYIDENSLALTLGKDIAGEPVIANLAKMPHLLIAGTTGSGKSVAINTMILSLLYKHTPKQCRMIMIDPKMLELSVYDDIPHLLSPVVTDPKKAVVALKWVVREMEERYRKMSKLGVRNIAGYNEKVTASIANGEDFKRTVQTGFDEETGQPIYEEEKFEPEELPLIVVVVDEMADLMMVAGKEIEACIQRLAQMARASGIHLIMATQRPSVDVITGTIKANFPTRISFQVTSKIDSRTILGEQGAEQLLGMGDMLYMSGGGRVVRVHGPFVSDAEVEDVVQFLKQTGAPDYVTEVTSDNSENTAEINEILGLGSSNNGDSVLYDQAVAIVARERKASTSFIQRKLQIGYNRAARIVEDMEEQGIITPANHVGKREVLIAER